MSSSSPFQISGRNGAIIPWSAIEEFKRKLQGEVLVKGQASEEEYRHVIHRWNEPFIVEASFVVFVENEADVAACLKFVQVWDHEVAVACGRHSYSGASASRGLVIDLSRMKQVSINEEAMTITAQGGCKAVDLETPLQALGLSVVFGNTNDTAVIDNLIAARIMVADGRVYEVSETQNSDLFWGLRGGGSNFGVITDFTYSVHKQADVFFGPLIFTPDKTAQLIQMAESLQSIVDDASGKLVLFFLFKRFPGAPRLSPGVIIFYDGPEARAKGMLAPLYNLGPVINMATTRPYADCNKASPQTQGPPSHKRYSTSFVRMLYPFDVEIVQSLLRDLDAFLDKYGPAVGPSKIVFELRSYKKVVNVSNSATASGARNPGIDIMLEAQFEQTMDIAPMRVEVNAMVDKVRAALARKNSHRGLPVNSNLSIREEKAGQVYGENLPRLRELKKKYDAAFVFNKWYPIEPAE